MDKIRSAADLEELLSRPTPGAIETLRKLPGDFLILGAAGKIGPSLARMIRRGLDTAGAGERRVLAVSRFSAPHAMTEFKNHGVHPIACDLLDRQAVEALPDAANILYLAGQKFGTSEAPESTWAMNTLVPAHVAERYHRSRLVVFSTGCVYPLAPVGGPWAREDCPLEPVGEYANSCVGRERIFTHFARRHGTPMLFYRLNYALDLRYGVLRDVAQSVWDGRPVNVTTGHVNVIWQGDANARAIQCFDHVSSPPHPLNVTGSERLSIRSLAARFGELLGRKPSIAGHESATALLADATRSFELFGPPLVSLDEVIEATARWVWDGGESLGKPTHFEARDGRF
ncbi:MAG TPA: NAD-dependent epimerase/dehydratase family protein [Chthoniobacter sp.]|jgi:nucleoside-diphosphate-sugar epimerase